MMGNSRFLVLLIALTVLGAVLRIQGIDEQPAFPDDVHAVWTSESYVTQGQFQPTMPYHPKLRNLLIYGARKTIGEGAWSVWGFSVLFGVLSIPLLGFLARWLTGMSLAGLLAAFFLCVDPVHITFSRQFIQEVHTAFFFLAGTMLALLSMRDQLRGDERGRDFYRPEIFMPLSGIAFGLGLACKAHTLMPMLVCIGLVGYYGYRRQVKVSGFAVSIVSLTVLPTAVFLLTYVPWFSRGYDLGDWLFMQQSLAFQSVVHQGNPMDSMIDFKAWLWFIKPFT
ncbi:ArnT family glycosyltransferase, partial [Nitrospirota bacterium]